MVPKPDEILGALNRGKKKRLNVKLLLEGSEGKDRILLGKHGECTLAERLSGQCKVLELFDATRPSTGDAGEAKALDEAEKESDRFVEKSNREILKRYLKAVNDVREEREKSYQTFLHDAYKKYMELKRKTWDEDQRKYRSKRKAAEAFTRKQLEAALKNAVTLAIKQKEADYHVYRDKQRRVLMDEMGKIADQINDAYIIDLKRVDDILGVKTVNEKNLKSKLKDEDMPAIQEFVISKF